MGLTPARGEWRYRLLASNSTATFVNGSLVAFSPRRNLVEYTSVSSAAVGIAQGNSVDSLPAGKVLVAVPTGLECTMYAQTGTLAQSALSLGQAVGIKKSGNTMDQVDATITSTVSALGLVYGPIVDTSSTSRIEIAWAATAPLWFSGSSTTFAS